MRSSDDEVQAGGASPTTSATHDTRRRVVPMKIGNATVYVEPVGELKIDADDDADDIHTVAPDPQEIFDKAIEAARECVRVVGERLKTISGEAMPQELTLEFSLTFDAKAKAALIPVFVTAEHGLQTGLKITAKWKRAAPASGRTEPGENDDK